MIFWGIFLNDGHYRSIIISTIILEINLKGFAMNIKKYLEKYGINICFYRHNPHRQRDIDIYKKRWNIEQRYKDLREYFGFAQEENRIYEALIARITLSMFTYNLLTYINRINHEPKTLGELFRDLECELEALAISMQFFLQILTNIANIHQNLKTSKELHQIIAIISLYTQKQLGFICKR
jgi:hypothetical protein